LPAQKRKRPGGRSNGEKEARGAAIGGTQPHSIRLPGFVIAFETLFGLPHERLTIRHDAGRSAPYVHGGVPDDDAGAVGAGLDGSARLRRRLLFEASDARQEMN
jgi:hypothetical protein